MKISVNSPKSGRAVEFDNANIGENFAEAVALNGEAVVYSLYADSAIIRAQASARTKLDKKDEAGNVVNSADDAMNAGSAYKPAVAAPRTGGGKGKTELETVFAKLKAHKAGTSVLPDDEFKALRKRAKELLEEAL